MEKDWLEARLVEGRSIESIAKEAGKHPSTVGYWVKKHGLRSHHAPKHAARGGVARENLVDLVERGMSIRQIAAELGLSFPAIQYWLKKYEMRTEPLHYTRRDAEKAPAIFRECATHGWTDFVRTGVRGFYRCRTCTAERVSEYRRRVKQILVEEAGGCCVLCGYDRYAGALQFHHLDPSTKSFALSVQGVARSLEKARAEAAKCVLICATCHAEVEAGVATIRP